MKSYVEAESQAIEYQTSDYHEVDTITTKREKKHFQNVQKAQTNDNKKGY